MKHTKTALRFLCIGFLFQAAQFLSAAEERAAIRLAVRESFRQGAHEDLRAIYREVRWAKPVRWKWEVVKEEGGFVLLSVSVNGHAKKGGGTARRAHGWILLRYPRLLDYVRPPKPSIAAIQPGKWVAHRTYRIRSETNEVSPANSWSAAPLKRS